MYLFVYIFLLLMIMGMYAQLVLLRASRIAENMKGVAEIMMVWHGGAYQLAKELAADITSPCYLSAGDAGAAPSSAPACARTLQNPNNPVAAPYTRHYLPVGYQFAEVPFTSIVYAVGATRYLVTYVEEGDRVLGYTAAQVLKQMGKTDFPKISYGSVQATGSCNGVASFGLMTNQNESGNPICYPTRTVGTTFVPENAVGLVSNLGNN